jgi:hypothetical protein
LDRIWFRSVRSSQIRSHISTYSITNTRQSLL